MLAFDLENRRGIRRDHALRYVSQPPRRPRWCFDEWLKLPQGFRQEIYRRPAVVRYCRQRAIKLYGSSSSVPYGRFLDLQYYKEG